jgi:hypothetical protein
MFGDACSRLVAAFHWLSIGWGSNYSRLSVDFTANIAESDFRYTQRSNTVVLESSLYCAEE